MNELGYYDVSGDPSTQGWTTIDVTRGGDGHPYADAWWPPSHGLGYENTFVNQAADMLRVIGGESQWCLCPISPTHSRHKKFSQPR